MYHHQVNKTSSYISIQNNFTCMLQLKEHQFTIKGCYKLLSFMIHGKQGQILKRHFPYKYIFAFQRKHSMCLRTMPQISRHRGSFMCLRIYDVNQTSMSNISILNYFRLQMCPVGLQTRTTSNWACCLELSTAQAGMILRLSSIPIY